MSSRNQDAKRNRITALAVGLSLIAILLIGAAPGRAATAVTTYDNVQVLIHTTNSTFVGTYDVTVYNSTGYALVTYSTPYPAASFELPGGSYIFSVSATSQYPYACPLLTGVSSVTASTLAVSSGSASGSGGGTAIIAQPCYSGYSGYPQAEYGYSVQQVSGPTTITISTQPVVKFPTTTITVQVHYANGTAAAGTSLYASVLGGVWYWADGATPIDMSGVTGTDGTAKLTVPAAPVEVTAWNWIPVNLPKGTSTQVVTIGGEKVNVTVNWEPSYVGLAGSVLIVPPQTSGSITLHVQQQSYWATPQGVKSVNSTGIATPGTSGTGATSATVASSPDLVPASLTSQQAAAQSATQTIVSTSTVFEQAQVTQAATSSVATGTSDYATVLLTIVGALALGIASASLIIVRRRPDV